MKKHSLIFFVFTALVLIAIVSCKKINEATELGGDLIPAVDNITTFEKILDVETDNRLFNDTTRFTVSDYGALGSMNDDVFGQTKADLYFNLSSSAYGTYPYIINPSQSNDPSIFQIDSVVLQLAYKGNYGDSTSEQTIQVFEMPTKISGFTDSTYKNFVGADLPTIGPSLGATSFIPSKLKDSIRVINKTDTFRIANVVRFRLDGAEALARRFASYDTTAGSNEGFRRDSAFKQLFGGLAVRSTAAAGKGGLSYFNLNDTSTKFIVYFKAVKSTGTESGYFNYFHTSQYGIANIIKRTQGGDFAAALASATTNDPQLYIQSTPGSFATIRIPALDTFSNSTIHRAELIVSKLPADDDAKYFGPQNRLFVDHKNNGPKDTAFTLFRDFPADFTGGLGFAQFGGNLQSDNTYRFTLTRHVQGIVTRHEHNDTLRLYAPLRTTLFDRNLGQFIAVPVVSPVAYGRVIVAGGSYPDPALRMRVRIIYSKL